MSVRRRLLFTNMVWRAVPWAARGDLHALTWSFFCRCHYAANPGHSKIIFSRSLISWISHIPPKVLPRCCTFANTYWQMYLIPSISAFQRGYWLYRNLWSQIPVKWTSKLRALVSTWTVRHHLIRFHDNFMVHSLMPEAQHLRQRDICLESPCRP